MWKFNFAIDPDENKRSRVHTVLESIQETENEDIEDNGHSVNPLTGKYFRFSKIYIYDLLNRITPEYCLDNFSLFLIQLFVTIFSDSTILT